LKVVDHLFHPFVNDRTGSATAAATT
jgi:hypothetical protein